MGIKKEKLGLESTGRKTSVGGLKEISALGNLILHNLEKGKKKPRSDK